MKSQELSTKCLAFVAMYAANAVGSGTIFCCDYREDEIRITVQMPCGHETRRVFSAPGIDRDKRDVDVLVDLDFQSVNREHKAQSHGKSGENILQEIRDVFAAKGVDVQMVELDPATMKPKRGTVH